MSTDDPQAHDDGSPTLRFEVLGPLRVERDGALVELGSVQQRAVLAILLLHVNHPVGRQEMINAIWGMTAPAYAVNLLQKHVSALRRLLEPDRSRRSPSRLLRWTDNGYLLTIPPGRLDLAEFEAHVALARTARAGNDVPGALSALCAALALCRGLLCDGLPGPQIASARDNFDEQRIAIVEHRIDADLSLGTGADLITELREMLAGNPLRERTHGLLMQALHHAGRRSEALTAYQETRRLLRDELGVEPGPELQLLHQSLLTTEPSAVPAVTGTPLPRPSQILRAPLGFAARTEELAALDGLLAEVPKAMTVAAIVGTAGVGKTALAVHWAREAAPQFPDGQLYANLNGFAPGGTEADPREVIRGFLDAFGVPPHLIPERVEERAALYRSLLADRRVLVVLDNARAAAQVRPLLPGSPGCLTVVTSRDSLAGLVAEGAHPVPVGLLSPAESRQLLKLRLGAERIEADPAAVRDLCVACAQLPLALCNVAAKIASHHQFSLAAIADQIRRVPRKLDAFEVADPATDVRAVLSQSYRTLSEPAKRLFRLLSLHPGPDFDDHDAVALLGEPVRLACAALAELARTSLVTEHLPGRYTTHDLIRWYALELTDRTETEQDRTAAARRLNDLLPAPA